MKLSEKLRLHLDAWTGSKPEITEDMVVQAQQFVDIANWLVENESPRKEPGE